MTKSILTFLVVLSGSFYSISFASDGHDHGAPGALPFAPHGGKLGASTHNEAEEKHEEPEEGHGENHAHEEEAELFFEGAYLANSNTVEIYPLALDPKNPKEFLQKSPTKDFSDIQAKIEFPRSHKFEAITLEIIKDPQKGEFWTGKVPFNKDIRFFVHLEVNEGGEKKIAKIHLEKKR